MADNATDNQLESKYENVTPTKAIPGQTIIRMAYKMNLNYYKAEFDCKIEIQINKKIC